MCNTNTTNIDVLNKEWKYIGECIKFCWYIYNLPFCRIVEKIKKKKTKKKL